MTIFLQMTKRQRLDDDRRRVHQLELELELARLRREEASREETAAGGAGDEPVVEDESTPPPTPQTGTSSAPAATTPSTAAPTPSTAAQPTSQGHGRGRGGARGGRFASLDHRGLQTVFVCIACDKIYCETYNAYEKLLDYWNRQ